MGEGVWLAASIAPCLDDSCNVGAFGFDEHPPRCEARAGAGSRAGGVSQGYKYYIRRI